MALEGVVGVGHALAANRGERVADDGDRIQIRLAETGVVGHPEVADPHRVKPHHGRRHGIDRHGVRAGHHRSQPDRRAMPRPFAVHGHEAHPRR